MASPMKENKWARLLAYITGLVHQELLLQNEYLGAENHILRGHLPPRLRRRERLGGLLRGITVMSHEII